MLVADTIELTLKTLNDSKFLQALLDTAKHGLSRIQTLVKLVALLWLAVSYQYLPFLVNKEFLVVI